MDLFKKNMKGWSHKKIILYLFCSFDLLIKKVENNFFMRAALLCANISQIFFLNSIIKNICAVYLRVCSTGPLTLSHLSASLSEFQLILVKIIVLLRWGFNSYQYLKESETDKICSPKYFYLK